MESTVHQRQLQVVVPILERVVVPIPSVCKARTPVDLQPTAMLTAAWLGLHTVVQDGSAMAGACGCLQEPSGHWP
jgi:hypothetical protein